MPTISFRVDKDVYEALKERAKQEGITVSELLRSFVRQQLGIKDSSKSLIQRIEELEKRVEELERELRRVQGIRRFMK